MRFGDIFLLSLNGITARKLRSALTSLGIILGAAAFVALVSMGTSVERQILGELDVLGADRITITPSVVEVEGGPPSISEEAVAAAAPFDLNDERAVERAAGVERVLGQVMGTASVAYRSETTRLAIRGVEPEDWRAIDQPTLLEGRHLRDGDGASIVIGRDVATDVFEHDVAVGQQILIGEKRFRVAGVLEEVQGITDISRAIVMPREQAWEALGMATGELSMLIAIAREGESPEVVAPAIEEALRRSRDVREGDEDFGVTTVADLQESIQEITLTFQIFMGAIATISLVVGGIGIANTMFMTVIERSKQIGILKAVGMRRREVITVFLIEACILGLVGGTIGSVLGAVAAKGFQPPVRPGQEPFIISAEPTTVLLMIGFAVAIGSIAGLIPAIRAANIPAVEVLRNE